MTLPDPAPGVSVVHGGHDDDGHASRNVEPLEIEDNEMTKGLTAPQRRKSKLRHISECICDNIQSHFSSMFWVLTLLLIGVGVAILAIASKSGAARGFSVKQVPLAKELCIVLSTKACAAEWKTNDRTLFVDQPTLSVEGWYESNPLAKALWDELKLAKDKGIKASVSPVAFYIMCMNKLKFLFGTDRFESPQPILSTREQSLAEVWAKEDDAWNPEIMWNNSDASFTVASFDPSMQRFASNIFTQQYRLLQPGSYLSKFECARPQALGEDYFAEGGAKEINMMDSFRTFIGQKTFKPFVGYGSRLGNGFCDWVPQNCKDKKYTLGPTMRPRPVIDLHHEDSLQYKAPESNLPQPPWNDWSTELRDQLFSDIVWSMHGALVQNYNLAEPTPGSWEVKLTNKSKVCGDLTIPTGQTVYVVATAWIAFERPFNKQFFHEGYLPYGADAYFDKNRKLVALYAPTSITDTVGKCYPRTLAEGDEEQKKTWLQVKRAAMATMLVLQAFVFHMAETISWAAPVWTAVYKLPVYHPVRSFMSPFGHRSIDQAHFMYNAALATKDRLFQKLTAFTDEGWVFVCSKALNMTKRWSFNTGTLEWYAARGLKDSKLPIMDHGSQIRKHQYDFVLKALGIWDVNENPTMDEKIREFRSSLRKNFGVYEELKLDTNTSLAEFLSELLYRQSVPHTMMMHHPVCHSTMANGKLFAMQLVSNSGTIFPASDAHMASSIIWDMATEPMPRLLFPLDQAQSFMHITGELKEEKTAQIQNAYNELREKMEDLNKRVHQNNDNRCRGATSASLCSPYSCIMPSEMLLSYGI